MNSTTPTHSDWAVIIAEDPTMVVDDNEVVELTEDDLLEAEFFHDDQ